LWNIQEVMAGGGDVQIVNERIKKIMDNDRKGYKA
jgi:hypothetical protein